MITPSKKGDGNERIHLHRRPFRWPCGGVEAYMQHCLMKHAQGYIGSHWMLPLGDYASYWPPSAAMDAILATIVAGTRARFQ